MGLEFVETSPVYPDWQAVSPHLHPAGPGAAWHSQNPGLADEHVEGKLRKNKEDKMYVSSFHIHYI